MTLDMLILPVFVLSDDSEPDLAERLQGINLGKS